MLVSCEDLFDARPIEDTTRLEHLDLSGSGIADLNFVRGMVNLRELRLASYKYLSDLSGLESLPSLEYVDLTGSAAGYCRKY